MRIDLFLPVQWFMQPTQNMRVLTERQNVVAFLVDKSNHDICNEFEQYIRKIKGIERILKRMTISRATFTDWKTIYEVSIAA